MATSRRFTPRVATVSWAFLLFAALNLVAVPYVQACPYLVDLGDNRGRLVDEEAIYAEHRHNYWWGYVLHWHAFQWGADNSDYVRFTYQSFQLKKYEQRMDTQSAVGALNALENLNDDTRSCRIRTFVVDAKYTSSAVLISGVWVPCQVIDIAWSWRSAGDFSRYGRVGEVMALAAFIVLWMQEFEVPQTAAWYWEDRHLLYNIIFHGTNPDFEIFWSDTITKFETYHCFFWCGLAEYGYTQSSTGSKDAMEVKTTWKGTASYASKLREAEKQLRSAGWYHEYLPTAVIFDSTYDRIDVYFEIAPNKWYFKFGG